MAGARAEIVHLAIRQVSDSYRLRAVCSADTSGGVALHGNPYQAASN
jgi:hypothetical protein